MEQQKLVSIVIAKFKIAYPYYFKDLTDEEFVGLISMYQEELSIYNEQTLSLAVKSIIKRNKFMPSLSELLDECEKSKTHRGNLILDIMKNDGYFKKGINELDDMQAHRNYEKALMWVEKGIIPDWLLIDMKSYGYIEDKPLLTNNTNDLLMLHG